MWLYIKMFKNVRLPLGRTCTVYGSNMHTSRTSTWASGGRRGADGRRGYWRPGCALIWRVPAPLHLSRGTSGEAPHWGWLWEQILRLDGFIVIPCRLQYQCFQVWLSLHLVSPFPTEAHILWMSSEWMWKMHESQTNVQWDFFSTQLQVADQRVLRGLFW